MWNPGMMNLYDLKYAAFYGECNHEVKPVMSGYRLCLTYNLVTVATATMPRFVGDHASYVNLKEALKDFFVDRSKPKVANGEERQAKRPRAEPSDGTKVLRQRDRKLVYMLEHQYTESSLSFAYLKNKDLTIAQSLAKFCEEIPSAFSLFLCTVTFSREGDEDCDDYDYDDKSVSLGSTWIKYGDTALKSIGSEDASLGREIAPTGFFENVEYDGTHELGYTGNEGVHVHVCGLGSRASDQGD